MACFVPNPERCKSHRVLDFSMSFVKTVLLFLWQVLLLLRTAPQVENEKQNIPRAITVCRYQQFSEIRTQDRTKITERRSGSVRNGKRENVTVNVKCTSYNVRIKCQDICVLQACRMSG